MNPPLLLKQARRQALRRLLPFLLLMYVLAFLDRANLGFAQAALKQDTGLSSAAFAFGAGVFFIGYALMEVPSNLIMHRVGARIWMCRIMVSWGLAAAAMAWVQGAASFYALRFILGICEAGFFPGIIYYLTLWFGRDDRAQALGIFYFGAPLAFIFGSPLSGMLLDLHGLGGLAGWQWMFLVEGLLASAVGVWAFFYLDNRPEDAVWLAPEARSALRQVLDSEAREALSVGPASVGAVFFERRILHLCAIYFLIQASVYGVIFYLPQQVAALVGERIGLKVGWLSALPWLCALLVTWLLPRQADRDGRHRRYAVVCLLCASLGIAVSNSSHIPVLAFSALCLGACGFIAVQPLFWSLATRTLSGAAAAGAIALINSIGSLGGFFAPNVKHWAEHGLGASAGLGILAAASFLAAILVLLLRAPLAPKAAMQLKTGV